MVCAKVVRRNYLSCMALRLLELVLNSTQEFDPGNLLREQPVLDSWSYGTPRNKTVYGLLVDAENTDAVLSILNDALSTVEDFRIVMLPVDATVPNIGKKEARTAEPAGGGIFQRGKHLSIEELYNDVSDESRLTFVHAALAVLSTLVAAFGILRGSTVMIIGAMVIAPLLGPNMAMSLGTTLGDFGFISKSLITSLFYFFIVVVTSVLIGWILRPAASTGSIAVYSTANLGSVVLSLAAGAAGALSFTIGLSTMLIGVTVALAVLPSLATCGMMLGSGNPGTAYGALLLFLTNIICINLAGVVSFLVQGIHPIKWWEQKKAKKAAVGAVILWALFLAALVLLIRAQKFS